MAYSSARQGGISIRILLRCFVKALSDVLVNCQTKITTMNLCRVGTDIIPLTCPGLYIMNMFQPLLLLRDLERAYSDKFEPFSI